MITSFEHLANELLIDIFNDPILLLLIPAACPNLHHLEVQLISNNCKIDLPPSPDDRVENHPLKRLILSDCPGYLSFDNIDLLLICLSNIERIHLILYDMPFLNLVRTLVYRLPHLRQFDCHVGESLKNSSSIDIDIIRHIHPCFNRIQCILRKNGSRIYTTDEESTIKRFNCDSCMK